MFCVSPDWFYYALYCFIIHFTVSRLIYWACLTWARLLYMPESLPFVKPGLKSQYNVEFWPFRSLVSFSFLVHFLCQSCIYSIKNITIILCKMNDCKKFRFVVRINDILIEIRSFKRVLLQFDHRCIFFSGAVDLRTKKNPYMQRK